MEAIIFAFLISGIKLYETAGSCLEGYGYSAEGECSLCFGLLFEAKELL